MATGGDPSVRAVKDATPTIPIVMFSSDPIGTGLVASLARPGGNITGLAIYSPELSAKRLELLKEALPGVSRVAVCYDPAFLATALDLRETQLAARALGVTLQSVEVHHAGDFERAEAFIPLANPFITAHRRQIVALAAARQLPAIYYILTLTLLGYLDTPLPRNITISSSSPCRNPSNLSCPSRSAM